MGGKNPLWVFCKQKYHSVHFWSAGSFEKIDIYSNTHRYAIAFTHIVLPARRDAFEDVREHACACEEESSLSPPLPWFSAGPSLWARLNQPSSPISTELPNLHQPSGWHGVPGSTESPGSLLRGLCKVPAALNADGRGSAQRWYRGVISFMGTFL